MKDTKAPQSKEDIIADSAWESFKELDTTPFTVTRHGQMRPAFDAPSRTHAIARATIDDAAHFDGMRHHLSEDSPVMQIAQFGADVNKAEHRGLFPEHATADQVIDAIVSRYKESKR